MGSGRECAEFERREKIGTVGNGETRQGRGGQGDVLSHGMPGPKRSSILLAAVEM